MQLLSTTLSRHWAPAGSPIFRHRSKLIPTQPHGDHTDGSPVVPRDFAVNEFAGSGQRDGGYAYNDLLRALKAERVPIVYPCAGAVWRTDEGTTLTFICKCLSRASSRLLFPRRRPFRT